MTVRNRRELEILRHGGQALARILSALVREVRAGVAAAKLDRQAEQMIRDAGGLPSFKGYRGKKDRNPYPATLCVSVNDELVHALPGEKKIFKAGDLVGMDIGMRYPRRGGLFLDTAVTIGVGNVSRDAQRLLAGTREALEAGIGSIRPGTTVGDVGAVIQKCLEKYKLGVVQSLAGHGVGRAVHEEPLVPNFGEPGKGPELVEGMVLAIEPMATLGDGTVELGPDGWAYCSVDGTLAAHFEHTIIVTADGSEVLTLAL